MAWCRKHGVSQTYWEYLDLPYAVIEDCRMVMRAEAEMQRDDSRPTQDLLAGER